MTDQNADAKHIMKSISYPAVTSVCMMLYKYKQYNKIISIYDLLLANQFKLDEQWTFLVGIED